MTEKPSKAPKGQEKEQHGATTQDSGASSGSGDGGASQVQEVVAEAQEKGHFGDVPDQHDYTATGDQGKQASKERAERVNPEGHGRATFDRGL